MSRSPRSSGKTLAHRFGQPRASTPAPHSQAAPLFKGSAFQPLPAPTGPAPYRLDLADVVPDAVAAMKKAGGMVLHMVGDTGGVKDPNPQTLVAHGLETDDRQPLRQARLFLSSRRRHLFRRRGHGIFPPILRPLRELPAADHGHSRQS
jgi:hypothetical protein